MKNESKNNIFGKIKLILYFFPGNSYLILFVFLQTSGIVNLPLLINIKYGRIKKDFCYLLEFYDTVFNSDNFIQAIVTYQHFALYFFLFLLCLPNVSPAVFKKHFTLLLLYPCKLNIHSRKRNV